jgi:hypothetical protein
MKRRDLLRGAAAAALIAALPRPARAGHVEAKPGKRPRMLIHILLQGGIDAIWTTDPKRKGELAEKLDLPYEESAILTQGGMRAGPLMAPLAPYLPRMAIVNGVLGATVAHQTGIDQTLQMRRVYPPSAAGIADVISSAQGREEPISGAFFGLGQLGWLGGRSLCVTPGQQDLLEELARLTANAAGRDAVLGALRTEAARCGAAAACLPVNASIKLLEGIAGRALPEPPALEVPPDATPSVRARIASWSRQLRDTFFLLENRLVSGVTLVDVGWDTHAYNDARQRKMMQGFAPALSHLLLELDRRRTTDGVRLADEVGIVILSELGRFPIKNEFAGKDHFPEMPAILIGPGIRPGQFGETDSHLSATPISVATGHPSAGAKSIQPTIDDLGVTILSWFGIQDPTRFGYFGRPLEFLLAA